MTTEFVKMSAKGQLVVPQDIREEAGLHEGERFVAFAIDGGVLFKRVDIPEINFAKLSREIQTQFRKHNIKKSDVDQALQWARKK